MFSSLFQTSYKIINFEDMQIAIKHSGRFLIINTLSSVEQDCLIRNTLFYELEEKTINDLLNTYDLLNKKIIIYGKNANDESTEKKYKQLLGLGFSEVYIYRGGMFEWMLLQDIYGESEFPTTKRVIDILMFKPVKVLI
jgi:hypothetical protein